MYILAMHTQTEKANAEFKAFIQSLKKIENNFDL